MNSPKEKAIELVTMFSSKLPWYSQKNNLNKSKQCAIIAVENEYNAKIQAYNEMSEYCPDIAGQAVFYANKEREQVKKEIEKL